MVISTLDEIYIQPDELSVDANDAPPLLIFFITGNPGLVKYYKEYLNGLHQNLKQSASTKSSYIYSSSLPGFELSETSSASPRARLFDLKETVQIVIERLYTAVRRVENDNGASNLPQTQVILIGHSVGAYILLEVQAYIQQKFRDDILSVPVFNIVGGICLFPTVIELALSPTGRKVKYAIDLPLFADMVHGLSQMTLGWLPLSMVSRVVSLINGMPEDAALTTAMFLQSRTGVKQALYLAKHELREITNDKWNDELWGVNATASLTDSNGPSETQSPLLYFYFGQNDHWVASATRDALIASRSVGIDPSVPSEGRLSGARKPVMEIDAASIPHDFCIRHSREIALKTADYIQDIIKH